MKKLLFLPLLALMFVGCSKDAMTEKTPDMAAGQTAKIATHKVSVTLKGWYTERWGTGYSFPTVYYMDENQNPQELVLEHGVAPHEFVTSSANLAISGFLYYGDKPYIGIKTHTNDTQEHPDGGYRLFYTGTLDEVPSTITVPIEEPISPDTYVVVVSVGESNYPMNYEEF